MTHIIVAVRDRQLNAFMRPFTAASPGQAIRAFRDEINTPGSELNRHPEDYELYQLATYDEHTGVIEGLADHAQLAIATNLIEASK